MGHLYNLSFNILSAVCEPIMRLKIKWWNWIWAQLERNSKDLARWKLWRSTHLSQSLSNFAVLHSPVSSFGEYVLEKYLLILCIPKVTLLVFSYCIISCMVIQTLGSIFLENINYWWHLWIELMTFVEWINVKLLAPVFWIVMYNAFRL